MIDLLLRDVVPQSEVPPSEGAADAPELVNVAVEAGRILAVGAAIDYPARQVIDGCGCFLSPSFVDSHLHLDIAFSNDMDRPGRTEPSVSMAGLNAAIEHRRRAFTHDEIVERASFALRQGLRHGTTAVRAQCHVDPEIGLKHVEALQAVKERFAGGVDVQIVAFPQQGLLRTPGTLDLFREAFQCGADIMGGAANIESERPFCEHIDAVFDLAQELDCDLDIHADLALKDDAGLDDLELVHIARRTIEHGYQGRVTIGHACTLDSATPEVAEEAIGLLKEANISVVSQPDLYRLGRDDRRHVRRGLTRVKEMLAAGVNVAYASNNVRDALRPLGNMDLLEEGLILAYGAHMDTIEQLETLVLMSTYYAARALRLPNYGLEPGDSADLVLLDAPSASAAIVGQVEKCYVFKAGCLRATNEPGVSRVYLT
jgi:cytosine/creatinine deaminase